MNTLFSIIIIISSVLLVFIVYVQNPKGGGLSSDFGAAQQIGGVQKTNDFIDKATWSLAAIVAVLSIILTLRTKSPERIKMDPTPTEQGQEAPTNNGTTEGSK
ncbi:MAG: preprotein translocase subunit SecG [Crocinitomicaceae bacterium]|nr:preprotein translocase subunit SecG [Crocinitomicaceae bacterium]|tara:strand:+ start:67941 stop:68249 length:309 start_codon:yes stop_codon:yes gene_type:complete